VLTAETQLAKVLVAELFLAMAEQDEECGAGDRDDDAREAPVRRVGLTRRAS
jgi:hypothetical protein